MDELGQGAANFLTHAVRGLLRRQRAGSRSRRGAAALLDATRELEKCDVLRKALGNTGTEDDVDYFVRVKQQEFQEWHDRVSDWEIDRYLQLF